MNKKILIVALIGIIGMMFILGCISEKKEQEPVKPILPQEKVIKVAGCKTEYFLILQLAEAFKQKTGIEVQVTPNGNKLAMGQLINGEIDIADCCKPAEKLAQTIPSVKDNLDKLTSYEIAKDALAVVVHPDNPITELSYEDLKSIYSGNATNWKDFGWETGGEITFCRIDPKYESGSALLFQEMTIGVENEFGDKGILAPSDNEMPQLVGKFSGMVGYCPLGKSPEGVKKISINGIEPTKENVKNDKYKLVTRYYLITTGEPKKEVKQFIDFVLSDEGQGIVNKDFISI
jgi:phosphate transport system substrate-binding protein